jgi:alkanesulfonate monooxygenase SsuD/methylene tetrahydromethanopterin reductase-like flavin-dependent oxidoreductase (luciferase family)
MAITRGSLGLNIDPSAKDVKVAFQMAQLADTTGIEFVGLQDHLYHPEFLDAWTMITTLSAVTTHVTVMTNVATIPLRPPAPLMKAASTLSLLSGGRVALGVGAGAFGDGIAAYGGVSRSPREATDAFEEALHVMRALNDPAIRSARVEGDYYQLLGAHPGPLPPEPVQLLVGSYGPRMLALTGQLSDGWSPSNAYAPPSRIPTMQRIIDEAAIGVGRDPKDVLRIYNVMGTITDEHSTAAQSDDEMRVVGPAPYWIDTLKHFRDDLGFDSFLFWPTDADPLEQAARFAELVLPELLNDANTGVPKKNERK